MIVSTETLDEAIPLIAAMTNRRGWLDDDVRQVQRDMYRLLLPTTEGKLVTDDFIAAVVVLAREGSVREVIPPRIIERAAVPAAARHETAVRMLSFDDDTFMVTERQQCLERWERGDIPGALAGADLDGARLAKIAMGSALAPADIARLVQRIRVTVDRMKDACARPIPIAAPRDEGEADAIVAGWLADSL